MPLKYALCPDGDHVEVEACLQRCWRTEGRCLTLPTLHAVLHDRLWTGRPSTTMLLNGTRLSYLKLTSDYTIDPMDRAYALLGTRHHGRLEAVARKLNVLSEEKLGAEVSGIFDLLEPDETTEGEAYILTDYKTWGSFKVALALGLVESKVPDPSGEVYKKSGKWGKAGDTKIVSVWTPNPERADLFNEEMQLNNYRILVEECGFRVSRMQLQVTVRDGDTFIATNRGVDRKIYSIPLQRLDDEVVKGYFNIKRYTLLEALETRTLPPPCSDYERWEGRRCRGNCDVAEFCSEGGK